MTKDNTYQIGAPKDNSQKSTFFKTKPINKDSNRKSFNNNEGKPLNKNPERPFNKNNRKPFNRTDRKPFDRSHRQPFDKNGRKPFERNDKKPFNRNERKPFNRKDDKKPLNRDGRKPFNRDEKRPFNRDERRPFSKDDRKPYQSRKFSNRKFDGEEQNKNIKQEEKEFKENTQRNDEKNINTNENKANEKEQKTKVQKIKHNRVIIRNLVFDINVNHLKKLLSPFGEILDIHIPQNPDGKGSRGFAFIEFKNRNNALKAIKQLNGTKFKGRPIVLDESVSKQKYLQSRINEDENANEGNKIEEQVKEKVKIEENKKQKLEMESEKQDEEEKLINEEEDEDEEEKQEEDEDNSDDKEDHSQKVKKEGSKRQKTESQVLEDISSEIFIRNLPITVNQQTLHSFFRKYGKLKFAKIVMNKETGLSKGTAFLKFEDPLKAKQLIQYSRSYEMNLLGKNPNFKVNAGINLQLEGTILKIFPVESRQNISEKLKGREEKDAKREEIKKQEEKKKKPIKKVKTLQKLVEYDPNDKRNLKLALLGINQVTEQMREKDQERFRNHEKQKLQKLKNPNNSVSDTRIVLKYLNKDITEQDIRDLCLEYLDEKSHKANDLTYCKLMLESLESKKSAGFGFVEFKNHQIALGFLQWIAEEPSKLMKEPFICEFAIQDSRKLQKLQNRNNNQIKPQNNKSGSQSKEKSTSKKIRKPMSKKKEKKHNK